MCNLNLFCNFSQFDLIVLRPNIGDLCCKETGVLIYSPTSLIRASLIRMPHNPNTVPLLFSTRNDSVIRMVHNPNTFYCVPSCSDKRGMAVGQVDGDTSPFWVEP